MNIDLDIYALLESTYKDITALAQDFAMNFIVRPKDLEEMESRQQKSRDLKLENNLIINQLYLLYEELSYTMNVKDIGHLELYIEP